MTGRARAASSRCSRFDELLRTTGGLAAEVAWS